MYSSGSAASGLGNAPMLTIVWRMARSIVGPHSVQPSGVSTPGSASPTLAVLQCSLGPLGSWSGSQLSWGEKSGSALASDIPISLVSGDGTDQFGVAVEAAEAIGLGGRR